MAQKYTVMEDGNNNWSALLKKYLRNEITPAEIEEMDRQMQSSPMKQWQFKEQTRPGAFINDLKEVYYFDRKKARERLQAKLPFLQQPLVIPFYKRSTFKWMVGIAAAIMIVIGVWMLMPVSKSKGFPIKKNSYVILPNGEEVNLENVSSDMPYNVDDYQIRYTNDGLVVELNEQAREKTVWGNFTVVTAAKKKISVRLFDGTAVQLNAQSTLSAPLYFNTTSRDVELNGEGYFTIVTNHEMPFVVSLKNKLTVTAEGTIFNIRSYENQEVATTLIEGKVKMKSVSDSILLQQGEQAETVNKKMIKAVKNPDIDQATAWRKKGDYYFKNMPIKDVMIEIGYWYGYDVEFRGQGFKNELASGKFERDANIDSLIMALEFINPVIIKREGQKLLVSPKR
jgi:ferric-dicitrate binding protein FerR (iron transport regulator)